MIHPNNGEQHTLTMANEDYLETIYRIELDQGGAHEIRSVDIAEHMNVSKASVSKAITTLKDEGYVEQMRYGKVCLTDSGREYAQELWRCHRMLRQFLIRELGVSAETADGEACLMEHDISHDTMVRWMNYLESHGLEIDG